MHSGLLTVRAAVRSFVLAALVLFPAANGLAVEFPDDLLDLSTDGLSLAPAEGGGVVVLDRYNRSIARWDKKGELAGSCEVHHPAFDNPVKIGNFAAKGNLAFIINLANEAAGEDQTKMGAIIVDIPSCEVKLSISIPGPPLHVCPSPDGWIVNTRPQDPFSTEMALDIYDDRGRHVGAVEFPEEITQKIEEMFPGSYAARGALFVTFKNDLWMVPHSFYELWKLKRGGESDRKLEMPACMTAEATTAEGEAAAEQLRRRFMYASPEMQEQVEKWMNAKKDSLTSFMNPVNAVAVMKDRLAVLVTDHKKGGCRLDIWDLTYEKPVFMSDLPWEVCPNFVALTDDHAWTRAGGQMYRFEIPTFLEPLADPCEYVKTEKEEQPTDT